MVNSTDNKLTDNLTERPVLRETEDGLSLVCGELKVTGDFKHMLPRFKQSNLLHEMLIKAVKLKNFGENPTAIDATAGLGEDSSLLAAAGFTVDMYEQNPVIAALLGDALKRAALDPELADIASRMHLHEGNSIDAMKTLDKAPDLIYLDPMFPQRQKSSLIKKKLQLFQMLEAPCSSEEELLKAAIALKPKKIIVKRPVKGPYLAGITPGYSISGSVIRYDCFVFNN